MRTLAIASALTLGLLCLAVSAATQEQVAQAIAAAKTELDKASALGYQWRDSKKMLTAAMKSANAGEWDTALTQAEMAKFQGEAAQAQAKREADAGPRF